MRILLRGWCPGTSIIRWLWGDDRSTPVLIHGRRAGSYWRRWRGRRLSLISGWSRCVEPLLIHSLAAPGGRLALKPLPVRNATLVTRAPDLSSTHIGALKSHFSAFFFFYQQRVFSPPLKFDSPARAVLQKTRCGEVLSLQAAF